MLSQLLNPESKFDYWASVFILTDIGLSILILATLPFIQSGLTAFVLYKFIFMLYNAAIIVLYRKYNSYTSQYKTTIEIKDKKFHIYKRDDTFLVTGPIVNLYPVPEGETVYIGHLFFSWPQKDTFTKTSEKELYNFIEKNKSWDEAIENSTNKQEIKQLLKRNRAIKNI